MIKKHWKTLILTSIIILLPIVAGLYLWNQLPDQIPSHWNMAGEVDGWSSKPFAVFGMPALLLGIHWLCVIVTGADPKKANHPDKVMNMVLWVIPILGIVLSIATYAAALGMDVALEIIMPLLIGLIFVIIGNYLPKCKQNYTIGIKIPWTLDNEENWNKTHRFAGILWVVCGLLIMLTAFLGSFWIFICASLVMVFAPLIYSYILHRKGI